MASVPWHLRGRRKNAKIKSSEGTTAVMDRPRRPFSLIYHIFGGFVLSALYGVLSALPLWCFAYDVKSYLQVYFVDYNFAVSGGLVLAAAILVLRTQSNIPNIIEKTFTRNQLEETTYFEEKRQFSHLGKTLFVCTLFAGVAFWLFYFANLPLSGMPEYFLIAAGCLHYALGVYIGRKIFYIAHMLRAIESICAAEEVFVDDKLFGISLYVNSISTLTAIVVSVGVLSYYHIPFQYDSIAGYSVKVFVFIPVIIAIPVLLLNYYPRVSIRRIYEQSIKSMLRRIEDDARQDNLPEFERRIYVLEVDRVSHDELNYRLRMTLADLPLAVTALIALLSATISAVTN